MAEKQKPNAVELLTTFMHIVNGRLRAGPATSKGSTAANAKVLDAVIGEYNQSVADKSWRVLGRDRATLKNLAKCPPIVLEFVAGHFQRHRKSDAVLTSELLCNPMFVPGASRAPATCPPFWQQVLTVQDATCVDFFRRVIGDFERKLGLGPLTRSTKQGHRLTENGAADILDSCLVWHFVQEQLSTNLPPKKMQQLRQLFYKGRPAAKMLHDTLFVV
jgi:hypothetical protein